LQALYQGQLTGQDPAEILRQFLDVQDMSGVDVDYFERLLTQISMGRDELDRQLAPFLDRPVAQVDLLERLVLRIGAYELLSCPELPFRVILNECVDLSHRFGSEGGHGYVNAVLDKAARAWRPAEFDAAEA
jgi:N utilization substance protein B